MPQLPCLSYGSDLRPLFSGPKTQELLVHFYSKRFITLHEFPLTYLPFLPTPISFFSNFTLWVLLLYGIVVK